MVFAIHWHELAMDVHSLPPFIVLMQAHASKIFSWFIQYIIKLKVTKETWLSSVTSNTSLIGKVLLTDSLYSPELSPRTQSPLPLVGFPFPKNKKKSFILEESILLGPMGKQSYKFYCRYKIYFPHYNIWMIFIPKHLGLLWDVQSKFKSSFCSRFTKREQSTHSGEEK